MRFWILQAALLVGLVATGSQRTWAQDKDKKEVEKAPVDVTLLVPERGHKETVVSVFTDMGANKVVIEGKGGVRKFTTAGLEKGYKYSYTFEALIEPNNYTKIYRTKKVSFKPGEKVEVDLRVKDPKNDKIVVRWVPTPGDIVDKMAEMAKTTKNDVVYDLGCGDAVMLIRPIKKLGVKKGVGIDIDPKLIEKAKQNAKEAGVADKLDLRVGDILDVKDMKDADVVLLYIGDDLGERLSPVLQKTMKPGARIVSHRFTLGDWKPEQTITVKGEDGDEYTLHLWIVPQKK